MLNMELDNIINTNYKEYISEEKIQLRLKELGKEIEETYKNEKPILIGVLKFFKGEKMTTWETAR